MSSEAYTKTFTWGCLTKREIQNQSKHAIKQWRPGARQLSVQRSLNAAYLGAFSSHLMDEDVSRTKTPGPTPYVGACVLPVMRSKQRGYVSVLVNFPGFDRKCSTKKKCLILSVVKIVVKVVK